MNVVKKGARGFIPSAGEVGTLGLYTEDKPAETMFKIVGNLV